MLYKIIAAAILTAAFASAASAKDIAITLNDDEQKAFTQILDLATKQGGINAAAATAYFQNKMQAANPAPAASPVPPAPNKE